MEGYNMQTSELRENLIDLLENSTGDKTDFQFAKKLMVGKIKKAVWEYLSKTGCFVQTIEITFSDMPDDAMRGSIRFPIKFKKGE